MLTCIVMGISVVKRATHTSKKEKTKTVSYRISEQLHNELNAESIQKEISQNVLVKQILEKYIRWDRFLNKIGMIPIPRGILQSLGGNLDAQDINMIVDILKPVIRDNVMFMKGKYDLKCCIETLENYMKASGIKYDHRTEDELHHFIIQHELGVSWSLLIEQLFKEIFHEFLPEENVRVQTTESTVILTVTLGSDFAEHDY
jgi:hypothetical protein